MPPRPTSAGDPGTGPSAAGAAAARRGMDASVPLREAGRHYEVQPLLEPPSPISLSEVEGLTGYMLLQTAQACPVVFRNFGMLFQEPAGDGIKTLHPEESQVSLEYVQIEVAHRRSGL